MRDFSFFGHWNDLLSYMEIFFPSGFDQDNLFLFSFFSWKPYNNQTAAVLLQLNPDSRAKFLEWHSFLL